MKIYYRISDKSFPKNKLPGSSKEVCLMNFCQVFSSYIFNEEPSIRVIADHCDRKTIKILQECGLPFTSTNLGNSGSLKFALEMAISESSPEELIYFVEDDYLHLGNACRLLEEGIKRSEYVTLYDHPDKYTRHYDGGEYSKVVKTASSHWRYTASTCMTFGVKQKTLKEDIDIWNEYLLNEIPMDHVIFTKLREKKIRRLAVCIPGAACHTDLTFSNSVKHVLMDDWAIDLMIRQLEFDLGEEAKLVGEKQGWDRLITLEAIKKTV